MRPTPRLVNTLLAALVLLVPAGAAFAQAPAGGKYALLIGVGPYDNRLSKLRFAERDVEGLAQALPSCGYEPENVWLMTSKEATKDSRWYPDRKHILRELGRQTEGRTPADSILVAFAGHGIQFVGDPECYLCPVDADPRDKTTLIPLSEVYRLLKGSKAGVKLVFADACRNDPLADTSRGAHEINLSSAHFQPKPPPGGIAILCSCSEGQEAFEEERLGHGIFFHFLIRGLKGEAADPADGVVTLTRLYAYLSKKVDDYARAYEGEEQTPSLQRVELNGDVTLVSRPPLVAMRDATATATAPPARSARPGGEVRRLTGHRQTVTSTAFFPDGRHALSGSFDGSLRVWDLDTGREVRALPAERTSWVYSVAVSADGHRALAGSEDGLVRLWDLDAGTGPRELRGHRDAVRSVAFSPDGAFALSGSDDGTVGLWDLNGGSAPRWFRGHHDAVTSVAFAADGRSALSGGADGTVRLWDVADGSERRRFTGHDGSVLSVALSADGRLALSGGNDRTVRVWEVQTGRQLHCFQGDLGEVESVAFSPDGRRALCGSADRTVRLWDVVTGAALGTLRGHQTAVQCVAFSPDGRRALSGSGGYGEAAGKDNSLRLWDLPE